MESSPKQTLIVYMRQRNVSYPRVINFLLYKYARNETIMKTQNAINNLQQLRNQCASNFADYVRPRTHHCGSVNGPINQIDISSTVSHTRSANRPPVTGLNIPIPI